VKNSGGVHIQVDTTRPKIGGVWTPWTGRAKKCPQCEQCEQCGQQHTVCRRPRVPPRVSTIYLAIAYIWLIQN